MNILPKYKTGNCSQCGDTDVPCTKVGKYLYCTHKCHKNNKAKQQVEKANERNKVRSLVPRYDEDQQKEIKGTMELNRWFIERRKEMTGKCHHCGGKSCKSDDKFFKFSICHILPKAYFPSVATHPLNFVELCFWDKNCHGNMDNKMLDLTEMACWDEIVTKFQVIHPHIAKEERRRIPEMLLQYLNTDM